MKILIAADGSRCTKRMVAYMAAHDELFGGHHDYTLVYVAPALPAIAAAEIERASIRNYHSSMTEVVFKPLRSFFAQQGLAPRFVARIGRAGTVISDLAEKGRFDLVLMGTHGHGALAQLVLGSVVTEVLARCKTPVLIVR